MLWMLSTWQKISSTTQNHSVVLRNPQELSESCRGLISTANNSQHTQTETDDDDKPRWEVSLLTSPKHSFFNVEFRCHVDGDMAMKQWKTCVVHLCIIFYDATVRTPHSTFVPTPQLIYLTWNPSAMVLTMMWQPDNKQQMLFIIILYSMMLR